MLPTIAPAPPPSSLVGSRVSFSAGAAQCWLLSCDITALIPKANLLVLILFIWLPDPYQGSFVEPFSIGSAAKPLRHWQNWLQRRVPLKSFGLLPRGHRKGVFQQVDNSSALNMLCLPDLEYNCNYRPTTCTRHRTRLDESSASPLTGTPWAFVSAAGRHASKPMILHSSLRIVDEE